MNSTETLHRYADCHHFFSRHPSLPAQRQAIGPSRTMLTGNITAPTRDFKAIFIRIFIIISYWRFPVKSAICYWKYSYYMDSKPSDDYTDGYQSDGLSDDYQKYRFDL